MKRFMVFKGSINGYKLFQDDKLKSPLSIAKLSDTNEDILIAGSTFHKFTSDEISLLFEHEVAHLKLNHKTDKRNIQNEIDADLYCLGKYNIKEVIALLEKCNVMDEFNSELIQDEIKLRLDYLKSIQDSSLSSLEYNLNIPSDYDYLTLD